MSDTTRIMFTDGSGESAFDESIIRQIDTERREQHARWGNKNDDGHSVRDWVAFIAKQIGLAMSGESWTFRERMVKVAALAIAAIEWDERQ